MIAPYFETELGKLYHGDCLEIMPELEPVDLVFTSPPYNMRLRIRNGEYTEREKAEHFSRKYKHFSDAIPIRQYYSIHCRALREMLDIAKTVIWNIQIVTGSKEAVFRIIGKYHKEIKDVVIWDKGHGEPAMHTGVINKGSEILLILEKDGGPGREMSYSTFGRGKMGDVWRNKRGKGIDGHGACFSVSLATRAILNWESTLVLDPFIGSGTTAIASELLNRKWIGIEISEEYCEMAAKRIERENQQLRMFK